MRRLVADGISPAQEKQRQKQRIREARSIGEFGKRWLDEAQIADSTRSMRKSIFDRDILPALGKRLLVEVGPDDLRQL